MPEYKSISVNQNRGKYISGSFGMWIPVESSDVLQRHDFENPKATISSGRVSELPEEGLTI
jgi:hypothetical protein